MIRRTPVLIVIALSAWASTTVPSAAESPFSGFEGAWRGKGAISLADGSQEAIRCHATYGVGGDGNALAVDVNCASDSYRVHLTADVVARGTAFSGSWQETTRQIGGDVTGRVPAPGEMQASFQALGGGFQLGARTNGRRQAIAIRSQGTDLRAVTITLKR